MLRKENAILGPQCQSSTPIIVLILRTLFQTWINKSASGGGFPRIMKDGLHIMETLTTIQVTQQWNRLQVLKH